MFSTGEMYLIFNDISEYISLCYLSSLMFRLGCYNIYSLEDYIELLTNEQYLELIDYIVNNSTPRELALFGIISRQMYIFRDTSSTIEEMKEQYSIIKEISHHSDGVVALFMYIIKRNTLFYYKSLSKSFVKALVTFYDSLNKYNTIKYHQRPLHIITPELYYIWLKHIHYNIVELEDIIDYNKV